MEWAVVHDAYAPWYSERKPEMVRLENRQAWSAALVGAAAMALVGVGWIGGVFTTWGLGSPTVLQLPSTALHAAATDSADEFVVATGLIDVGLEGVFFLDTLSGDLQCTVFNPRAGKFNALFRRNIRVDLQLEQDKRPDFLLVTGAISLGRYQGITGPMQPGGCVAYVVEANSGKFAAYAVPWQANLFSRGQPQVAELVLLQMGNVRTAAVR
jgi:hypothetical protein